MCFAQPQLCLGVVQQDWQMAPADVDFYLLHVINDETALDCIFKAVPLRLKLGDSEVEMQLTTGIVDHPCASNDRPSKTVDRHSPCDDRHCPAGRVGE